MQQELVQRLINFRRDIHRNAESAWTEFYTTTRIIEALQREGIFVNYGKDLHSSSSMYGMPSINELENAWKNAVALTENTSILDALRGGYTGCIAEIRGKYPGKTTVIRVDIDACDLEESHDASSHTPAKLGFDSTHTGKMHACGHDAHAAIGLGTAIMLQRNRDFLHGIVRILFQPAEEGLRGAASMVKAGVLIGCDHLIGMHVGLKDLPTGTIAVSCADFLSSTKLDIHFHGKAAHAGVCPELGRNALAAAAKATLELLDLPNRFDGVCRVNVGTFHAGSGRNIIPAEAHIAIETRADHPEKNQALETSARLICKNAADEYGCTMDVRYMGGSYAAECNSSFADTIKTILTDMPQIKNILSSVPFGGGEDVTMMMQFVQANGGVATELLFCMPLIAPHHSEQFDIDEAIIPLAAEALAKIALSLD